MSPWTKIDCFLVALSTSSGDIRPTNAESRTREVLRCNGSTPSRNRTPEPGSSGGWITPSFRRAGKRPLRPLGRIILTLASSKDVMGLFRGWDVIPMIIEENDAILGAIQRLMQRSSAKILSARRAYLVLSALLLLSGSQVAHANQCFINGPPYRMELDTVEWRMKIRGSENCLHGVRFSYVWNATVGLVSPPQFGQVTLKGPGFSYTAKSDFQGEDSFVVSVSGSKNKACRFSTIRVLVSVIGAQEAVGPERRCWFFTRCLATAVRSASLPSDITPNHGRDEVVERRVLPAIAGATHLNTAYPGTVFGSN